MLHSTKYNFYTKVHFMMLNKEIWAGREPAASTAAKAQAELRTTQLN
jgi:hypothetical protein